MNARNETSSLTGRRIAVLLAVVAIGVPAFAQTAADPQSTPAIDSVEAKYAERLELATPQSVLDILREGNKRFRTGKSTQGQQANDARQRIKATSIRQRGLAMVISCIDSRVAPELVLDAAIGDLYSVRMGANVVGEDALGSIEVAVASGAKVVLVMGHTRCAGVRAACAGLELEHFTQLLARVRPAISKANAELDKDSVKAEKIGERIATNARYVSFVSHANARWQAEQILARSQTVREAVSAGKTWLIPALYDVDSGDVAFEQPLKVATR